MNMIVKFTDFPKDSNWVHGIVASVDKTNEIYSFEAKLYDEGSNFGINGGRVSKLRITDKLAPGKSIVSYDRGWDLKPESETDKNVFREVMNLLENSPKRFEGQ